MTTTTVKKRKESLEDVILNFVKAGKEYEIGDIIEYVQKVNPDFSVSNIRGRLSILVSKGKLAKPKHAVYSLATDLITSEDVEEVTVLEEPIDPKFHPMLKRELTEAELKLVEINKQKVRGVTLTSKEKVLMQQFKDGTFITALFFGDPGNGKTTIARAIGAELSLPVYSQNYGINSEELDIIGGFIPDEENGGFKWNDGLFTQAFRNGGLYIAEEPNYGKPGVLGIKNNALDGVGEIVLRNGEVVQRHPSFRYIACMNVGLAGTQRMNNAYLNRMPKKVKFEPLTIDRQVKIVRDASVYKNVAIIRKMVEASEAIKKKIKRESVDNAEISVRNVIAWANDVHYTKNIIESAKDNVIWGTCMEDEDFYNEVYKDIILPRFKDVKA